VGLIGRTREALGATRYSVNDYAAWVAQSFMYQGNTYGLGQPVQQTLAGQTAERIGSDFPGLAGAYQSNGVIFACMMHRQLNLSAIRFQYQRLAQGRPSEMFGDTSLELLEKPWPGGTTQDLLTRVENDASLAGNSFHTTETGLANLGGDGGRSLVRLRPDWVGIVLGKRRSGLGSEKLGYVYQEGGFGGQGGEVYLLPDEVAHYAPLTDPLASHRGMSWLTPVIRDVQNDGLMSAHKRAFFENGATVNLIIKHPPAMTGEKVREFQEKLDAGHKGTANAYKTLHIGGGADVVPVGTNLKDLEFAVTQGHGENRICIASGVPSLLIGLSSGADAAQYANYSPTRRAYADGILHPLWQNMAGSFEPLLRGATPLRQKGVRLWYDTRDVPLLREDEKAAAEIVFLQAQTMNQLIMAGYTAESVRSALLADDLGLLKHSGLFSVQLQKPGTTDTSAEPPAIEEAP